MSRVRPREDETHDSFQPSRHKTRTDTQTDTQTDLELSRSFEEFSTDDEETPFFDLTPYTLSPFVLTESDAKRLHLNVPLRHEREALIPEWTCTNDRTYSFGEHTFIKETIVAKNHNGFVMKGSFRGNACIAKILYLNAIQEMHPIIQEVLIQAILLEMTEQNRKLPKHCTKIPRLEAFGRTNTYLRTTGERYDLVRQEQPIPAAIIVMEKIQHDLHSFLRQEHITNDLRSNICAAVFQQVAELLIFLSPCKFMHADLKMNNVTFNLTKKKTRQIKPVTFIIDFGMASLDYKGIRIGAGMIFNSIRFKTNSFHNPYTDLTYLAWSMWRFHQCDIQVILDCNAFTRLFSKILQRILQASGIPFGSDRRFDKISKDTFHAMLTVGLDTFTTTYAQSSYFRPTAITPEQIQHYSTLYMKAIGSKTHGKEARAKLLRVLEGS